MHLSIGRELLGCATASDYNVSLFAGGKQPHSIPGTPSETDIVDILNHTTQTWSVSHLSVPRKKVEATRTGKFMLFAGGEMQKTVSDVSNLNQQPIQAYSSAVDIYNLESQEWSTANLSVPRQYFAITSVGKFAIFAGGFANNAKDFKSGAGSRSDVVDIFDSETQKWTVSTLAEPRSNFNGVSIGDRWAIFGGGTPDRINPRSTTVDIFDAHTGIWSIANLTHPGNPSAGRVGMKAVFQGGSNSNIVDVFDFAPRSKSTSQS
jgi:hypothetical protein